MQEDSNVESNRIMKQTKPIFLCGLMGSGKSTVGRILASKIGVPFVDLDEEIERKAGKTVSEIFAREGEARFRELERLVLMDCIENDTGVFALGGGALQSREIAEQVADTGTLVYLETSVDVLAERLLGDDSRPLLQGSVEPEEESHQPDKKTAQKEAKTRELDGLNDFDSNDFDTSIWEEVEGCMRLDELKRRLQALRDEREGLYQMAAVKVCTDGVGPDVVANKCLDRLIAMGSLVGWGEAEENSMVQNEKEQNEKEQNGVTK